MSFRKQFAALLLISSIVMVAIVGSTPLSAQDATSERYMVTRFWNYGEASTDLFFDSTGNLINEMSKTAPEEWILSSNRPSRINPVSDWIASQLIFYDTTQLRLQVQNLSSGEVREVIGGVGVYGGVWSPDGRYLTISFAADLQNTDLMLYDLQRDQIINLTNDSPSQGDFVWAADGQHLATITSQCEAECEFSIALWDAQNQMKVSEISLASVELIGSESCNLASSFNGMFVSFEESCSRRFAGAMDFPNDIYLWDVQAGELRRVTTYGDLTPTGSMFLASYQQQWIDETTLLIGADYPIYQVDQLYARELFTYNVNEQRMTTLSTEVGSGFSYHHNTRQLVLRHSEQENLSVTDYGLSRLELTHLDILNQSAVLRATDTRSVEVESPCEMDWSPDGTTLVVTTGTVRCDILTESVVFIDVATGTTNEYRFEPISETPEYIVPIGWLHQ
jgi:WD40 repeat protein